MKSNSASTAGKRHKVAHTKQANTLVGMEREGCMHIWMDGRVNQQGNGQSKRASQKEPVKTRQQKNRENRKRKNEKKNRKKEEKYLQKNRENWKKKNQKKSIHLGIFGFGKRKG
jgi:hypothetical protein